MNEWIESALTNQSKNKSQSLNMRLHWENIDTEVQEENEKQQQKISMFIIQWTQQFDNVRKILKSHLDNDFDISIILA